MFGACSTSAAIAAGGSSVISCRRALGGDDPRPGDELVAVAVVAVGVRVDERADARAAGTARRMSASIASVSSRSKSVSTSSVASPSLTSPAFDQPQPPSGCR